MLLRVLPLLLLTLPAAAVEVELSPGADIRALTSSIGAGDTFIFVDEQLPIFSCHFEVRKHICSSCNTDRLLSAYGDKDIGVTCSP